MTYHASGNSYEALTAPQTVAKGEPFIRVELGGGNFYFRPQNDVVLEAGSRYIYTVKVNATGLTLEGCTIGGWEPGQGESGAAEDLAKARVAQPRIWAILYRKTALTRSITQTACWHGTKPRRATSASTAP